MICIVGAGLTGLALAHELAKRGVDHVVLEATDRPGGVIRSARVGGRVLDFGPQRFRMTESLAALVGELGLEGEVVRAPEDLPLFVYAHGALREVPFSLSALVTGDLLTWRGKLRLAWEPLTTGPREDERVSTLLARKLGREAYERLAGPLYGGLFASDPADMIVGQSLAGTLRELGVRRSFLSRLLSRGGSITPPAACSFREGLQTLTDALHAANPGSVRLGTPVRGLRRSKAGWAIESDGGVVDASAVVLTCEAPEASRLLTQVAPGTADRLAKLNYNPLAVVHLDVPDAGLRGLGYQVALGEDLATRGVTWNESLFGRPGIHTAFLGGAARPEVIDNPDDGLGAIAAAEFRHVTGREARALRVTRVRMPAWDATWRAVEGLAPPFGIRFAASWESRPGIAGRLQRARTLAQGL
jgi:oxygen-dependent protoporphyrinogen oxidase